MSRLLAVAARELRERWILFPGALASGCFPLVLPAFGVPRDAMPAVGLVGAVLLAAAAGIIMGASMLARDTANGRLGFLFARPVSWPAIWGGKWLAALLLVVASGVLTLIPWMTVYPPETHGGSWLRAMRDAPGSAIVLTAIVLAVGLANFGATLFRSRSPWAALDLVFLLLTIWATRRYVGPLWLYDVLGLRAGDWNVAVALAPLALGLLVGSVAQVAVGRTDIRRAHVALSSAFWAVIGLTLVGAGAYWAWIRSAGPADVNVHAVTRDPSGRWIYVEGARRRHGGWYPHGLLIDTGSGRYAARPEPHWDRSPLPLGLLFSADGRFAALPQSDGQGTALALFDLTSERPKRTDVTLESSPPPTWSTAFALSPSAASVFVAHESGASLFALPSGRRVATTTMEPGWQPAVLRFLRESEARAWLVPATEGRRARSEMRVVDLGTDGQARAATFPIAKALDPVVATWRGVVPDAPGRRFLTHDGGLHLRDGATGELRTTLVEGREGEGRSSALFLADGRIVVAGADRTGAKPPRTSVQVFDAGGAKLGEVLLDLWPWGLSVGPEVTPGRVAVSSFRSPYLAGDTFVVDVGETRVVERLSGLRPAVGLFGNASAVPADAGPTSVHFFRDASGRVIRIDFATGERKVVAGPGAPRGERVSVR